MKYFCFILLTITFLLSGCFSGKEYPSGLLNSSELQRAREEQRMIELRQTKTIRLGIVAGDQKNTADLQRKLESKGWKIQLVVCPEKRMTGLLRSGVLDVIYFKGSSEKTAEQLAFYFLSPSYLVKNQLLYREINGL